MTDRKVSLLLVDDNEDGLLSMEAVLRRPEYELVTAKSGAEAVALAREREFAAILLDVQMPGMDGFETARLLKQSELSRDVPILFLTAIDKDLRYVHQGYEVGAVDYLFKPYDPFVLRAKVGVFVRLYLQNQRIREQERALRSANLELELRVRERTVELERANLRLKQEISEHEKLENHLRAEKKSLERVNLELDSFVYIASHDLRTPLRAIACFANFLQRDYFERLDDQGKDYLEEIMQSAVKMSQLIEDLLTLSRVSRVNNPYERVDLKALMASVAQRLDMDIRQTGAELRIQDGLPELFCDRIKMTEVLVNLVSNAVKFSSKREGTKPVVEVGWADRGEFYEIFVKDNGIGISPQYHGQIFDMFRRLHSNEEYEGTGAGLHIVKRVVEGHGGTVRVESELGQGAKFILLMPKADRAPVPEGARAEASV